MNTKELFKESIRALENGEDVLAAKKVSAAFESADLSECEKLANDLYSKKLATNEDVALKFKNLFSRHLKHSGGTDMSEATSNPNFGFRVIKWVMIVLLILLVVFVFGEIFTLDIPTI